MASVQGQSETKSVRRPQLIGILLIVGVAAFILLAIWLASLLPPLLRYGVWLGIALIPVINRCSQPCAYLFRKSRGGVTLLNLGNQNRVSGWHIAKALLGIFWLILAFTTISYDPALKILQFGLGVFYLADALVEFIASREPTLITDKGVLWPEGMVLWDKIESHQWLKVPEEILLALRLKGRPWPLEEKKLRVPASRMADVDKLLRERI